MKYLYYWYNPCDEIFLNTVQLSLLQMEQSIEIVDSILPKLKLKSVFRFKLNFNVLKGRNT